MSGNLKGHFRERHDINLMLECHLPRDTKKLPRDTSRVWKLQASREYPESTQGWQLKHITLRNIKLP